MNGTIKAFHEHPNKSHIIICILLWYDKSCFIWCSLFPIAILLSLSASVHLLFVEFTDQIISTELSALAIRLIYFHVILKRWLFHFPRFSHWYTLHRITNARTRAHTNPLQFMHMYASYPFADGFIWWSLATDSLLTLQFIRSRKSQKKNPIWMEFHLIWIYVSPSSFTSLRKWHDCVKFVRNLK